MVMLAEFGTLSLKQFQTLNLNAANFLYMLDGEEPSAEKQNTMDMCYVLHADHGMNASTFSARVTIATLTDIYSAVTAAIGTLKGPLHGGANEGVIKMLQEIGSLEQVDAYIEDALCSGCQVCNLLTDLGDTFPLG